MSCLMLLCNTIAIYREKLIVIVILKHHIFFFFLLETLTKSKLKSTKNNDFFIAAISHDQTGNHLVDDIH